jgi:2-C-methyl-D-erythritol 2,4-cyclodiphosphate synthase
MAEAAVPRSGIGFDVHRFAAGRELWLGGLRFDGEEGLAGHSDGDAVCHAIADALLGASALGDVGAHFPENDASVAGIAGTALLARTVALLAGAGFTPSSCDVTVICDRPSLAPRRDEMRARLAETLGLDVGRVSVKGTRPEGLGLVGDGVGCLAIATVT